MKKTVFILALLVVIVSVSVSLSFGEDTAFNDLTTDHWAYKNIAGLSEKGVISGYPDGSFKPKKEVTYAEFIKMATLAGGDLDGSIEAGSGSHWATLYYEAGLSKAYFTKWDIPRSDLDLPIPRKDMALIASGIMGEDVKVSDYGDYDQIMSSISDVGPKDSHEFYIVKAYAAGVLSGYPDGTFKPDGVLTRAEAASVIDRLSKVIAGDSAAIATVIAEEKQETAQEEPKIKYGGSLREDYYDLVAVEENPSGFTKGTVDFRMFEYSDRTAERQAELLRVLKVYYPGLAEEIHKTLITYAAKAIPDGKGGMRKQYFGGRPVLMEHMEDVVGLYVLPVGPADPYWGLKPGQIIEEFF
ncbi:hypothetical protein MASR2M70_06010 [Bacillota bacterium]